MGLAMRQPKIQTLTWDEFFRRAGTGSATVPASMQRTSTAMRLASPLVLASVSSSAHAAGLGTTTVMVHALWPIITLVQAMAFPVAFLGMSGGMLLVTLGNRSKGIQMVKWAAIGYVGFQLVPAIMMMLHTVGVGLEHTSHLP